MAGEGEPLLLIPGLDGSAAFWDPLVPLLAPRFTIILMDHRGTGRSERPQQSYSVELLARDAIDVLDHFGIASTHIVGHSTGGAIAQVLAIEQASRVRHMVLSGSWASPDPQFRLLFEARLAILNAAGPQALRSHGLFSSPARRPGSRINFAEVEAAIARANDDFSPVAVAPNGSA